MPEPTKELNVYRAQEKWLATASHGIGGNFKPREEPYTLKREHPGGRGWGVLQLENTPITGGGISNVQTTLKNSCTVSMPQHTFALRSNNPTPGQVKIQQRPRP